MDNIARWNGWFRDHDDLIVKARTAADIRRAKEEGRTAIILGFQNTSAFEDKLGAVQLFKDVGVGIAQLTTTLRTSPAPAATRAAIPASATGAASWWPK